MKEGEICTSTAEEAGQLRLYSFIFSLLEDAFRLDFNHKELNSSASKLKLLLVQLQTNLKHISDLKHDYSIHSGSEKMLEPATYRPLNHYPEKDDLGKNYQQEIMDTIAKIEEGHFIMSPSLSFRVDNILPVLKLLFGKKLG